VFKAASGQSVNLVEFQNSSGTPVSSTPAVNLEEGMFTPRQFTVTDNRSSAK